MGTNAIVGLALIAAGMADAAVAMFLVGPRIPDRARRQMIVMAILSSSVLMLLLGGAIAMGVLDLEAGS